MSIWEPLPSTVGLNKVRCLKDGWTTWVSEEGKEKFLKEGKEALLSI